MSYIRDVVIGAYTLYVLPELKQDDVSPPTQCQIQAPHHYTITIYILQSQEH